MTIEAFQSQGLFLRIADTIRSRIISGLYLPDERIPSVRELAVEMEVNPNTAMRAIERLQMADIIYSKRGMGYFVSPHAPDHIRQERREHFLADILPQTFREMELVGISADRLPDLYNQYLNKQDIQL